jgi:hypothetical protein
VYERTTGNERKNNRAYRLLHELTNDLAAIQMRVDILLNMTATSETSTSALVKTDLVMLRDTAEHAITMAEQFDLFLTRVEGPAIDDPDA